MTYHLTHTHILAWFTMCHK